MKSIVKCLNFFLDTGRGIKKLSFWLTEDLVSVAVIAVINKMLNICQDGGPSVMLIQLIEDDLFFLIIMNLIEVAELNDLNMQIFIIRNKKLFQFINIDLVLIYMQIIQIEMFKFEDAGVKCINQVSDLFIAFINLCDAVGE